MSINHHLLILFLLYLRRKGALGKCIGHEVSIRNDGMVTQTAVIDKRLIIWVIKEYHGECTAHGWSLVDFRNSHEPNGTCRQVVRNIKRCDANTITLYKIVTQPFVEISAFPLPEPLDFWKPVVLTFSGTSVTWCQLKHAL